MVFRIILIESNILANHRGKQGGNEHECSVGKIKAYVCFIGQARIFGKVNVFHILYLIYSLSGKFLYLPYPKRKCSKTLFGLVLFVLLEYSKRSLLLLS